MWKGKEVLDNLIIGRVEPHIYAFTTETIPNYLKVGDTYRPVSERINEWKQKFPNLKKKDNWEWSAKIGKDEEASYFRDFAVHKFLEDERKRTRLTRNDIKNDIYFSNEFFKSANSKDVDDAIKDINKSYKNNDFKYDFFKFEGDTRLRQEEHYRRSDLEWKLRNNQQEVVDNFIRAVDNGRTNLLMYAVMRFGKSFTSLMCAKAATKVCKKGSRLIVVVSGKADVKDEWKQNVEVPKNFENFVFLEADNLKANKNIIKKNLEDNKQVVCFLTLQDLQGKDIKEKHKELFKLNNYIDLLIIDETHFGARADKYGLVLKERTKDIVQSFDKDFSNKNDDTDYVDSEKADGIVKSLNAKVRIHLSGTPYRILMGSEFEKDDIIAFFQFDDILNEKEKWANNNIDKDEKKDEWENPYYGFPQMVRFACNLNKSSRERLEELKNNGIKCQLSELFKPRSIKKDDEDNKHKQFIYENEIKDMLLAIDGSKNDNDLFSFLNYDKIKNGNMCRHIVMVLPYCASCDAMEALIHKMSKKKLFKNLNQYEILNVSGHEIPNEFKKISNIKNKIKDLESNNKKTITLTVNRMLTGVTVREWDTMLYLKDTSSAQEYDQAIFRLQNQYIKEFVNKDNKKVKIDMKPQTLLVDYYPSRMFVMQENKSFIYNVNVDEAGNDKIEERINKDLKISPIVIFDENSIKEVTPNDVMAAVANYSKDRGVADEVNEIPIDFNLMKDKLINEAIIKENELGSKNGLSIDANKGEEVDDDGNVIEQEEDGNDSDNKEIALNEDNSIDEDEKESLRKKFKNYYSRILFYSYLSKSKLNSLNSILVSLRNDKDNNRILNNLGLDEKVLANMSLYMHKGALRVLDYKIGNLNKLSREQKMGIDSANVAMKKFGRLGESEIVTPQNVADNMVSLIKPKDYKKIIDNKEKILDIASKMGEFAVSIVKLLQNANINQNLYKSLIYSIPTSSVAYEFTMKVYELLGLDTKCIAQYFNSYDLLNLKRIDDEGHVTKEIDYDLIKNILSQKINFCDIQLDDIVDEEEKKVKFRVVVGNPPYQKNIGITSDDPIYNYFMDLSYKLSTRSILITPARFLFDAGKTPSEWNKRMLNDEHLHVVAYTNNSKQVFNTDIMGGIVITIRDEQVKYDPIITFYPFDELKSIKNKVMNRSNKCISDLVFAPESYKLSNKVYTDYPELIKRISKGHAYDVVTNIFIKMPEIFKDRKGKDLNEYQFIGLINKNTRVWKYVKKCYINMHPNLLCWKVILPKSNGSNAIGIDSSTSLIGEPLIGKPLVGHTQSFISIGTFKTKNEAEALFKYVKTKFARTLLGILKITQDNKKNVWKYVPLQDFTNKSDINWFKSISDIDKQLYKKYKLTKQEIAFIEKTIKPMT